MTIKLLYRHSITNSSCTKKPGVIQCNRKCIIGIKTDHRHSLSLARTICQYRPCSEACVYPDETAYNYPSPEGVALSSRPVCVPPTSGMHSSRITEQQRKLRPAILSLSSSRSKYVGLFILIAPSHPQTTSIPTSKDYNALHEPPPLPGSSRRYGCRSGRIPSCQQLDCARHADELHRRLHDGHRALHGVCDSNTIRYWLLVSTTATTGYWRTARTLDPWYLVFPIAAFCHAGACA